MAAGDVIQAHHIDRQAGQIDWHDGAGVRTDGRFDLIQIDIAGHRVDIDENRCRADRQNDIARGDPRNWRGDDFVTRTDAGNAQCHFHRRRAVGKGAHWATTEVAGQLGFEFLYLRARSNPAGAQHIANAGDRRFIDRGTGEGDRRIERLDRTVFMHGCYFTSRRDPPA